MLLLELELASAFLSIGFGFGGAVGVDGLLCKVVGAAASEYEGAPAIAEEVVSCVQWRSHSQGCVFRRIWGVGRATWEISQVRSACEADRMSA